MVTQVSAYELHEAAREEWLATKSAQRIRRMEILDSARSKLDAGEDPDREVLPALYRDLAGERMVDAALGFIVTHCDETLMLGFVEGFSADVIVRCLKVDFGETICGTVAQKRAAMHVTNIQDSDDPCAELVRAAGMTACASEPLIVDGRLLGTLSFATRSRRSFDPDDIRFFHCVAEFVAIARYRSECAFELRRSAAGPVRL